MRRIRPWYVEGPTWEDPGAMSRVAFGIRPCAHIACSRCGRVLKFAAISVRHVHALSTKRESSCISRLVSTGTESATASQQSLEGS